MRRASRYLFAAFCLFSLLLSIGAAVLWVRSYSGTDYLARRRLVANSWRAVETHGRRIAWTQGDIRLSADVQVYYPRSSSVVSGPLEEEPPRWEWGRLGMGHFGWDELPVKSFWNRVGFHSFEGGMTSSFAVWSEEGIAFPAWLAVVVFVAPPLVLAVRVARGRRRWRAGLCRVCGYDLRASPATCPECGAETAPPMIGATA